MKKLILYTLLAAVALGSVSCRRAAEKARQNISIEALERIEMQGMTGFELVLQVKNDTGYKLVLGKAKLEVFYAGSNVGVIRLRESVQVARHTTASVALQWQLQVSDPLALYVMTRKFKQKELSQIAVSYELEGKGGPAGVNISRKMVPLSDFLSTFGIDFKDIENYLK